MLLIFILFADFYLTDFEDWIDLFLLLIPVSTLALTKFVGIFI